MTKNRDANLNWYCDCRSTSTDPYADSFLFKHISHEHANICIQRMRPNEATPRQVLAFHMQLLHPSVRLLTLKILFPSMEMSMPVNRLQRKKENLPHEKNVLYILLPK